MRKYYDEHLDKFLQPNRARFSYLKVPSAHFEAQVTPTDDDLRKRYDTVKLSRYLKDPLGQVPAVDYPLTPEEQAKLGESLFKPFDAVKEELKAEFVKTEARNKSRTFATELGKLLAPPLAPPPPAGQPAPEAPKSKTPQEIIAQYAFLQAGETGFFSKDDAEKILGELYAANPVSTWLKNVAEDKPLSTPVTFLSSKDGATLFFVCTAQGEKEKKLAYEESTAELKKALNMGKAMEAAAAKASAAVGELRAGKAAAEALPGERIETCGPISLNDCVNPAYATRGLKMVLQAGYGVTLGAIKMGVDTLPRTIETEIVRQIFSDLKVEDKVLPAPLEDRDNSCYYVVRIAKEELPDAGGLTKEKEDELRMRFEYERQIDRMLTQWPEYLRTLVRDHVKDMLPVRDDVKGALPAQS
jgi:hypothetical protein